MKTNKRRMTTVLTLMMVTATCGLLQASDNYLLSWQSKTNTHTLGAYLEVNGSYASVRNEPSGYLGYKLVGVLCERVGIGLAQKALWHDYDLNTLVNDGEYQLQAGFSGLYLEYLLPVGDRLRFSFSLTSGYGLAQYEYKKDYFAAHRWYERIIDQDVFHFNEPALGCLFRLSRHWWMGADVSFKAVGDLNLMGTDNAVLNGLSAGISIKYGIF